MSIRDELTQICETHGLHSWSSERPEGEQVRCWCGWVGSRLWDHQLDVIFTRYAVVELPEPDEQLQVVGACAAFDEPAYVRIIVPDSFIHGHSIIGMNRPQWQRDFAAALLAAANRAEAQQ